MKESQLQQFNFLRKASSLNIVTVGGWSEEDFFMVGCGNCERIFNDDHLLMIEDDAHEKVPFKTSHGMVYRCFDWNIGHRYWEWEGSRIERVVVRSYCRDPLADIKENIKPVLQAWYLQ